MDSPIQMLHWRHTMVDGTKFLISYQRLAFLSSFSSWQLIQNLAPSIIVWCQCEIQLITRSGFNKPFTLGEAVP